MLSIDQKVSFLEKVSAFKTLNATECKMIAEICDEQHYAMGDHIFKQGEMGNALYIIVSGQVLLDREIRSQTDTISVTKVEAGSYFGEIALFYEAPYSVTATASQETTILKLDNDDFCVFACEHSTLLVEINHILCERLIEAYDKISEITENNKPRELRKLYDKLDF